MEAGLQLPLRLRSLMLSKFFFLNKIPRYPKDMERKDSWIQKLRAAPIALGQPTTYVEIPGWSGVWNIVSVAKSDDEVIILNLCKFKADSFRELERRLAAYFEPSDTEHQIVVESNYGGT